MSTLSTLISRKCVSVCNESGLVLYQAFHEVALNNVEHSNKRQTLDRTCSHCSIIVHLRPVVEWGGSKLRKVGERKVERKVRILIEH